MSGFRITCPNCGPRAASEFAFGGELIEYPSDTGEALDVNYARVWLRDNRRGSQSEQWFHHAGCRRWLTITRDTSDNVIA